MVEVEVNDVRGEQERLRLTMEEKRRIDLIIERTCQRYGINQGDLRNQDPETMILILEEIHWEMIQDIIHYS